MDITISPGPPSPGIDTAVIASCSVLAGKNIHFNPLVLHPGFHFIRLDMIGFRMADSPDILLLN